MRAPVLEVVTLTRQSVRVTMGARSLMRVGRRSLFFPAALPSFQRPVTLVSGPVISLAKLRDVRDVMFAMPLIQREHLMKTHHTVLWMIERSVKLGRADRFEQSNPAIVQRLEQHE